jgi:hypothetical protein
MVIKRLLAGLTVTLLAGCASQPNVYYTLTASEPGADSGVRALSDQAMPGLYTLTTVAVPAPVDDTMLVVRRSDDQLMKLAHDRWTAPLGKQVGNALVVALTRDLGMPPLSRTQAAGKNESVTQFSVDVQRFDMVPGQYAALAAVWQISPNVGTFTGVPNRNQKRRLTCYTTLSQAVQPGVAPLVRAQQRNLQQLARAMVQAWVDGQPPASTRCRV